MRDHQEDFTDYGGGVTHDDPNPEDEINKILTDWINSKGHNQINVYWDRKRSYNSGRFDITTQRRPDLLIEGKENCFAVEVKRGTDTSAVYDAARQAYQYWLDIETGEAQYSVNGNEKNIDAVLVATEYSPSGHLFENCHSLDPRRSGRKRPSGDDGGRGVLYPTDEHASSQTYVRLLHRLGPKDWAERNNQQPSTGIGALYSSALDGHGDGRSNSFPAAFHIIAKKGRYAQSWDYLPFWRADDV
jgi:hypothetical protein